MRRWKSDIELGRINVQLVTRLNQMVESEVRFATDIQRYFHGLELLNQRWQQDTSTENRSLEALVACFRAVQEFCAGMSSASLESLSERLPQVSEQVDQDFPNRRAMAKLRKTKIVRVFENESGYNLDQVLQSLYAFTVRWLRFWDSLLETVPADVPERAVCARARAGFARFQQGQAFSQAADAHQDQIEQLRRATRGVDGDWAFLNDIKLHFCAAGGVLSGTLNAPVKSQGLLFLFEKHLFHLKTVDRSVKCDARLNFWMLRSPMFPGAKVVEVLGTQFSFVFETPETDGLLKAWGIIGQPMPTDFGIFQRIALSECREQDWIEVDQ
jgi:hypothetical protein